MKRLRLIRSFLLILFLSLLKSCATYEPQFAVQESPKTQSQQKVQHSVFLAGGFGNGADPLLTARLGDRLKQAGESSTLIFTGDNLGPEPGNWNADKKLLDQQIALAREFKGQTIFLPGNNEWKDFDADKVEQAEDYIEELDLPDVEVYPENACPIEHRVINDQLDLILVDSNWFNSNWSRVKGINRKCTDILTRRRFLEELEGYINDGQGKNILIAMHNPVFSNGVYAGKETFRTHLLPLPVLGTVLNLGSELSGFSPELLNSRRYNYLRILVSALAKKSDRIIIASGHEESLQYLEGGGIHQLIAGSLSRATATQRSKDHITTVGGSLPFEGQFTYGEKGFAQVDYYKDGSSKVNFYAPGGKEYSFPVLPALEKPGYKGEFTSLNASVIEESVLEPGEMDEKTGFYKFMWGERYREYFGKEVVAPVALLDTLYGGLKVTKEGGGHQSYSIRLEDREGREYSMRSLRKNALKFLKFKIKGIAYTEDEYEDTWTEELISDFFTTAHPYMQLVINPLARAVKVNHSSPSLFYIPKQAALGELNSEFGGELYFIEERPSDEQMNFKGYRRTIDEEGAIDEFESTTDMLEKIKEDESRSIDQRDFIRARLFDMLIGDWDRHQDQWRWVEYEKEDGDDVFLPVPRDRDNAFPKFDGAVVGFLHWFLPVSRRWESYGPEIRSVKWLNTSGTQLDKVLTTQFDADAWVEEALFITKHLDKNTVNKAFDRLPKAVRDSTSYSIQASLLARLEKLPEYAREYSRYLDKVVALHATEKDDRIEITRLADGKTRVVMKRLLSDEPNELFYERTFDKRFTREIWIYGLGEADEFYVDGQGDPKIFIRLVGGYGKDSYAVSNRSALKVYDWKHEENTFHAKQPAKQLTNAYKTNTFHWRYFDENSNVVMPNIGFRTDDGFFLGAANTFTYNGLNGNPFRQQHRLSANYYFKFQALELAYKGIFANIFPTWNFELDGYYTSDRYSQNFFGLGNESINREDQLGRDYYRSRMQISRIAAGIAFHTLKIKALYESFKVQELPERFFIPANLNQDVFETQGYLGGEVSLYYSNEDAKDFPTKALSFGFLSGYKWNPDISDNHFGYTSFHAGISHKLIHAGHLVLSSKAEVRTNWSDGYFYYHAATLGGNNGLRGYRDERFAGKTYFYQTSDLRLRLKRFVTPVMPVTLGTYAGFDYGRVWLNGEDSSKWHTSLGGGVWLSGLNFLAFNAGFFNSEEGNIIQVGFGFQF